jgi:hypothetical protein
MSVGIGDAGGHCGYSVAAAAHTAASKHRKARAGSVTEGIVTHRVETAFIFDLDGTLIDSVYQHVLAWRDALDSEGIELSVWRIHRKIGMSGGLFTNILLRETGLEFDAQRVERMLRRHAEAYSRNIGHVRPLPGARDLSGSARLPGRSARLRRRLDALFRYARRLAVNPR